MPMIHETRIDDLIASLPELEPLDRAIPKLGANAVLICAGGFEDRARHVVEYGGEVWHDVLVITYPTNSAENKPAREALAGIKAREKPRELPYSRTTFWTDLRTYVNGIPNEGEGTRVVVDVSGMSSYVFYPVMEAIRRVLKKARLGVLYVEADQYHPRKDVWEAFRSTISDLSNPLEIAEQYQKQGNFESRGPADVYSSQLFPGINVEPLATQVVVVPSFGLERIKEMVAYAEEQVNVTRDEIKWLFGNPPDRQKNGWRLGALLELYCAHKTGNASAVSTRNYAEMLRVLDEIWEKVSLDRHMVIATVGSKMQHLATFLFLCLHPEVGLILSEPKEFDAKHYSDGVGPRWWLDFGKVDELWATLARCGSLEYQW